MPSSDQKRSLLLNGGIDNRSLPELVAPLVQQGESPKLIASTNTRLSKVPGTCTRAPKFTRIKQFSPGTKRWGIIPSRLAKNALSPGGVKDAPFTASEEGGGGLGEGAGAGVFQESYVPARIVAAGGLDAVPASMHIAIGYNATSGLVWRAYPTTIFNRIYVSVWTIDGAEVASPGGAGLQGTPTLVRWVGITNHGASGDRLWYADTQGICYRTLTVAAKKITLGPEVVVVVPGSATAGIDVISDGGNFAYLAHAQSGSTTGATVRRVDVTSGVTTHSVNIAGALAGGGKCAAHYGATSIGTRVMVAFSRVTGAKTIAAMYDATLSPVGTSFERDGYGDVACGFFIRSGYSPLAMVFVSATDGDFYSQPGSYYGASATEFVGTRIYGTALSSFGTSVGQPNTYPWLILQAHLVHWTRGSEQYPIVFWGRSHGDVNNAPGGGNYIDDPCVTAWLFGGEYAPIARMGCVRGTVAPAYTAAQTNLASRSAFMAGDRFMLAYRKLPDDWIAPVRSTGRYVLVDLASNQPTVAHDKDGDAIVAAAQPMFFDGSKFYEIGAPLHAPKISIPTFASSSGVFPDGTYSFCAVYKWTDNASNEHRSRVSNTVTHTEGPSTRANALFLVTPDGINAKDLIHFQYEIYATPTNGKGFFLYRKGTITNQFLVELIQLAGVVDPANPQIYSTGSDGEELLPQPAPPLRDITIIGPRAWGIDAEVPTRVVYTKLRVAGVGYEFVPSLEINLPSDAGEALAVREWQGLAVVLCERGVWQISGDGPSNTLNAGEETGLTGFSQPTKLSDIGCSNTASAVAFPGGVIWQSGQRFALLSGAGVGFMADFNCLYDVSHALLLRRYEEIVLCSSSVAEARVYNYSTGRWTTWDSQVLEGPVSAAALLPYDEDLAFLYSETTGFLYRLDTDTVSGCANMTWETDWTLFGGDFQDHILVRDVVFNGTILGPHSITIEIYCDYESTPSTPRTWSATELAGIAKGGRYTVRVDPKEQNARAVKLKLYDTVATAEVDRRGVQPRSLTLVYAIDGMLYETVFVEGSRK